MEIYIFSFTPVLAIKDINYEDSQAGLMSNLNVQTMNYSAVTKLYNLKRTSGSIEAKECNFPPFPDCSVVQLNRPTNGHEGT